MVVKVSKPEINVREKISELDKPSGTAGQAMLAAETVAEQQVLIGLSNRNLILNGDFQVFQRGTSSTSAGYQTVDRWRNAHGGLGAATQSHTEDGPSFAGHRNSYKILSTATTGSVPAGADPWVKYEVESRDIECLNLHLWKKELTLSFWIKTNKPGQHSISLNSGDFSSNVFTVPYNISGTEWQKVTVTFPPPPANLPSGSTGLRLYWSLGAGSTYQQALSDTNRWVSAGKYEVVGNTRIAGVNGAFIQIAGVQLELGKVATPFEHRSYGQELALCERYYEKLSETNTLETLIGLGVMWGSSRCLINLKFNTEKRTNPTVSFSGSNHVQILNNGGWRGGTSLTGIAHQKGTRIDMTGISGATGDTTSGIAAEVRFNNLATDPYIAFDAEL